MIRAGGRFAAGLAVGALAIGALAIAVGLVAGRRDARVEPVEPGAHFDPGHREVAAAYAARKYSYWASASILRWGTLAGIVALGGGFALASAARRIARGRRLPTAFLTGVLLLVTLAVVNLPIAWSSGYATERAYGLSNQDALGWVADWSKRQAFWIPVYAALLAGFVLAIDRWPRRGWIVAAGGGVAVAIAGTFLAPRLIDPLFHDFRPLEEGSLRDEIEAIGRHAGLEVERVLVMDASRRTNRLNAYVTGLGATRQVVLWDTLLERAPRDEVLLIVAHEIGHAAERHVPKGLLWSLPAIVLGAFGLQALARHQARHDPALVGPGDPAGLPLLWLAVSMALFLTSPAVSAISRRMEAEADWISLELTRDPQTFERVEERVARANLSPVTPPGWLVFWLWSHPPVLDRIGMARHWNAVRGDDRDRGVGSGSFPALP